MSSIIIFEKTYHGFEDSVDLDRDISELFWEENRVPAEFQGNLKVLVWYEPAEEEQCTR